jgi:DnaJ homolog subfamily C member 3
MRLHYPLHLALFIALSAYADKSASQHVSEGNRLLAEGSYSEAARAYSEAIDLDPNSYVNYYKRATAYLSLGRHTPALEDFDSILKLNPGFVQVCYRISD